MIKVYELKHADRRILLLSRDWQEEYGKDNDFDIASNILFIAGAVLGYVNKEDSAVFVAEDKDGNLVGAISCHVFINDISCRRHMKENAFFVKKNNKIAGIKLIKAAIDWGLSKDCEAILLSASNIMKDTYEGTKKIYKRLGFKEYETTFMLKEKI